MKEEGDEDEFHAAKNTSASVEKLKMGKEVLEKHITTAINSLLHKDRTEKEIITENTESENSRRNPKCYEKLPENSENKTVRFCSTSVKEKKKELSVEKKAIGITRGESIFQDMPANIYDDMPSDTYEEMPQNSYLDLSPDTFKNIPVDIFQDMEVNK